MGASIKASLCYRSNVPTTSESELIEITHLSEEPALFGSSLFDAYASSGLMISFRGVFSTLSSPRSGLTTERSEFKENVERSMCRWEGLMSSLRTLLCFESLRTFFPNCKFPVKCNLFFEDPFHLCLSPFSPAGFLSWFLPSLLFSGDAKLTSYIFLTLILPGEVLSNRLTCIALAGTLLIETRFYCVSSHSFDITQFNYLMKQPARERMRI